MEARRHSIPIRGPIIARRRKRIISRCVSYSVMALLTVGFGMNLASCSGKPKSDGVINVEDDDQEMNAAIEKARTSLPAFWQVFEKRDKGEGDFSLKVQIKDSHGTEHFWANDIERKDGKILGTINNDPEIVKSVKIGDRITIPEADISDWLYVRGEKMVGNYTLRVLFKQMPPKEVEFYKQRLADP